MKKWPMLVGALALMIAVQPAEAQVAFGPQVAYGADTEIGFGGRVEFDLTRPFGVTEGFFAGVFGIVSGNFYPSPHGVSDWNIIQITGNVAVPFPMDAAVAPYAGAGLQWTRFDFGDTGFGSATGSDTSLNVLGGIKFPIGGMNGFAEGNFGLGSGAAGQLSVMVGILFGG
jgi:hypothetical protein